MTIHQSSSTQHFYTSNTKFYRKFPYSTQTYLIPIMLPFTLNQCYLKTFLGHNFT